MAEFNAWLSQFRVNKGERYSHLGMEHTRGRFYIPEDSQNEFEKKYYEHVFSQKGNCDLIELHVELCCLLYDLDFKLPKDSERARIYPRCHKDFYTNCNKNGFKIFTCAV